jgi:cytochrome c oxidase subunit 3
MTASSDVIVREHAGAPELHAERGINTALLGMLLFIASEVMFFAGLFAVYFNIRASHREWPPGVEHWGPNIIVFAATIILIVSSFTMQWGIWRIRRGDRTGMNRALIVTLVLGVTFLVMQGIDYSILYGEGIRLNSGIFGSLFYTMTGFHGAHVFGGVVGISVMLLRGLAGQFSARHHVAVEAVSIYWHFVDAVWIALFTTIYLLR